MLQFTFELLPIFINSILSFVSINCVWIFFLSYSLFSFQDGRNLISDFNYSSSTNLSFVSKMLEELSHWVLPLRAGVSECQWRFPEASSIGHALIWNLIIFRRWLSHHGDREAAKGKDGTQPPALTLFLWHWFLKNLVLKDRMATIYTVLNLFLLKKEVTYCLVSSHGLCLAGCVWRSQESLVKEGRTVWLQ